MFWDEKKYPLPEINYPDNMDKDLKESYNYYIYGYVYNKIKEGHAPTQANLLFFTHTATQEFKDFLKKRILLYGQDMVNFLMSEQRQFSAISNGCEFSGIDIDRDNGWGIPRSTCKHESNIKDNYSGGNCKLSDCPIVNYPRL